ncbi:MAG: YmdB family metallophosphoesterase [Spirochaetales bacterium]|nr:YmdB family metallophosphoesterase [Spirochaetales bacterium]
MGVKVLYIGEIVGKAGIFCVKTLLPEIKKTLNPDFIIANGEGATGGFGLGKNHSIYLKKLGIDVLTGGEKIYYKKDLVPHMAKASYILRPANYPPGNPGRGWRVYGLPGGRKIAVICLLGQTGFPRVHLSNPYTFLPDIVARLKEETPIIVLDFHAATTAEKQTMFYHGGPLLSAVFGSHGKVQTSDEGVLKEGAAVITDAGRTGSQVSVGGLDSRIEIDKFLTQIPERSQDAWEFPELQGLFVEIGEDGKALSAERIKIPCKEVPHDRDRNGEGD